jgi:hypothetical protein
MCEDAISRITAVKTSLEKDIESKVGDLEIFQSEMSNLEVRFKLGLVPPETYSAGKKATAKNVTSSPRPKPTRDKQMDLLELGLDGIGNGIIWLGERMVGMFSALSKNHHPKN